MRLCYSNIGAFEDGQGSLSHLLVACLSLSPIQDDTVTETQNYRNWPYLHGCRLRLAPNLFPLLIHIIDKNDFKQQRRDAMIWIYNFLPTFHSNTEII